MKLTIEQSELVATLTQSTAIVEARNTIPVLSNVKIMASGSQMQTVATDLDIEVTANAPATVDVEGGVTVNAKMLLDIVKKLSKGALVSLTVDGYHLYINSGRSNFKLATLPVEDFPVMVTSEYDNTFTIATDEIASLINRVSFAQSTEETRYYLNGVYLHNDANGNLCGVATDGTRLAKMTLESDQEINNVIVPRKTVAQLKALLIDGDVEVSTSPNKIRFVGDGYSIVSKVVDGTYPDYTRVIPSDNKKVVTVSAKDFGLASARVSLVSEDRVRAVKLAFSEGMCVLSVKGANGDGHDEVEVAYSGEDFEIGFNSKILADAIAQADVGDVNLSFGDSGSPVLIEPHDYAGFMAVVMPMRI